MTVDQSQFPPTTSEDVSGSARRTYKRSWFSWRAPWVLRSRNADKIRTFIENAKRNRCEYGINTDHMAQCLVRFYAGFHDRWDDIVRQELWGGKKLVNAFHANSSNRMRRAMVSYLLALPVASYPFDLLRDLHTAGFHFQRKDFAKLRAHVLYSSRASGRGAPVNKLAWDRGLRVAERMTIHEEAKKWLSSTLYND